MSICDNCRFQGKCSIYKSNRENAELMCLFTGEQRKELSAYYEPISKVKKPPIVFVASYNEVIELAFNPDTKDSEAAKAKDALRRAQQKGGDINLYQFIIPFFPGNGKIKFVKA